MPAAYVTGGAAISDDQILDAGCFLFRGGLAAPKGPMQQVDNSV